MTKKSPTNPSPMSAEEAASDAADMAMGESDVDKQIPIPEVFTDGIDDSKFVDEQTSFPPYWEPSSMKRFYATVIDFDDRGSFPRYVLQAKHPVSCFKGPAESQEIVIVNPPEFFTVSVYEALPLHRYMGCDVLVTPKAKRTLKASGNELWEFRLQLDEETKRMVDAERKQKAALAVERFRQMRADKRDGVISAEPETPARRDFHSGMPNNGPQHRQTRAADVFGAQRR